MTTAAYFTSPFYKFYLSFFIFREIVHCNSREFQSPNHRSRKQAKSAKSASFKAIFALDEGGFHREIENYGYF